MRPVLPKKEKQAILIREILINSSDFFEIGISLIREILSRLLPPLFNVCLSRISATTYFDILTAFRLHD